MDRVAGTDDGLDGAGYRGDDVGGKNGGSCYLGRTCGSGYLLDGENCAQHDLGREDGSFNNLGGEDLDGGN